MPHRYFTTEIADGNATLRGADAHHLARVMRGKLGDTVILCDGNAVEYTAVITGAEGGFAAEEAEMAAQAGAKTVGLGPRILRCETAPLAVLSAVMTLTGNLE